MTAYLYRRVADVIVRYPSEGVGSGDGTPVGGGGFNVGCSGGQMYLVPVSVVRHLWRGVGANDEEVKRREDKHNKTKLTPILFMRA